MRTVKTTPESHDVLETFEDESKKARSILDDVSSKRAINMSGLETIPADSSFGLFTKKTMLKGKSNESNISIKPFELNPP